MLPCAAGAFDVGARLLVLAEPGRRVLKVTVIKGGWGIHVIIGNPLLKWKENKPSGVETPLLPSSLLRRRFKADATVFTLDIVPETLAMLGVEAPDMCLSAL